MAKLSLLAAHFFDYKLTEIENATTPPGTAVARKSLKSTFPLPVESHHSLKAPAKVAAAVPTKAQYSLLSSFDFLKI